MSAKLEAIVHHFPEISFKDHELFYKGFLVASEWCETKPKTELGLRYWAVEKDVIFLLGEHRFEELRNKKFFDPGEIAEIVLVEAT